jgi:hypothetical protein
MDCNTSLTHLPIFPRLPRGLIFLLIVSLLLHLARPVLSLSQPVLPTVTLIPGHTCFRAARLRRGGRKVAGPQWKPLLANVLPRLCVRSALLATLLQTSGWHALTSWSDLVLLLPLLQALLTLTWHARIASAPPGMLHGSSWLHRTYQFIVAVLLVSTALHVLGPIQHTSGGLGLPMALGVSALSPDDETEIYIDPVAAGHFHMVLRGTFHFTWASRDHFEEVALMLFLRRLQRAGETIPFLSQAQVGQALGVAPMTVSRWEALAKQFSWHVLSDRYRHAVQSVLPEPDLSRAILQVWVPAFWLSAWDVRERLIQRGVIQSRETLDVESIHAIAKHTGFNQVRDLLLERFCAQDGKLIAKENWWLRELVALNERLIAKLEKGERLQPQEIVELEPLRLKTSEKQDDFELTPRPLAATLKSFLFDALPAPSVTPSEEKTSVRCTYCDSDQVAPKSKTPLRKTVINTEGKSQVIEVLRYYCHNPECKRQTFTHFPPGVLPHARYPLQMRLVAVEVYETLLTTYRRSARVFGVKAVTVYHWVASLSPAATCLAAYLGVVRTSGVVGIDDKWILVCSPSAVRPHGRRPRAVWRYAYFAIDIYSYDLLALELYPQHNDDAVRLILLELKAKGVQPRVVVSDLDPAYGRMLPLAFPNAVHHECIFHALKDWSAQLTKIYGRDFRETRPEVVPLHDALMNLFKAQTQKTVRKRYADLMALRATYVAKTPAIASVFDSVENHFPKLVNAIESADIPRTNNATELVIRRFDQHYQTMCGLDTLESAKIYLRVFELVYRLTPFAEDGRLEIRGKSPLELAGYDLKALPIADFFMNLRLPPLSTEAQIMSQ